MTITTTVIGVPEVPASSWLSCRGPLGNAAWVLGWVLKCGPSWIQRVLGFGFRAMELVYLSYTSGFLNCLDFFCATFHHVLTCRGGSFEFSSLCFEDVAFPLSLSFLGLLGTFVKGFLIFEPGKSLAKDEWLEAVLGFGLTLIAPHEPVILWGCLSGKGRRGGVGGFGI